MNGELPYPRNDSDDDAHVIVVTRDDYGITPIEIVDGSLEDAKRFVERSDRPCWILGSADITQK